MGNNSITCYDSIENTSTTRSKLSTFIKSKLNKYTDKYDDFFIKYVHNNKSLHNPMNSNTVDRRRAVFISVLGLYQTWQKCPYHLLYSALCILPLKQQWIYHPSEYVEEIHDSFISDLSVFSDIERTKEFIELLKWKDSQGLVCWMMNDYEHPKHASKMVDPCWYHLNNKITNLCDITTGKRYKPLDLNTETLSKYSATEQCIMNELYFLTMNFKAIQAMLCDSNPDSLYPITSYTDYEISTEKSEINECLWDEFEEDEDRTNWWISDDYNP